MRMILIFFSSLLISSCFTRGFAGHSECTVLILDAGEIFAGNQKSGLIQLEFEDKKKKEVLHYPQKAQNVFCEESFIDEQSIEKKQEVKLLKSLKIISEPKQMTDLLLTIPGEIDGIQVALFANAFSSLKSDKLRLHLFFQEKNGKKVLMSARSECMFAHSPAIYSIDFSGIDTSRMICMQHMFMGCSNITKLDLSFFDLKEQPDCPITYVEDLGFDYPLLCTSYDVLGLLEGCNNLQCVDITSFPRYCESQDVLYGMVVGGRWNSMTNRVHFNKSRYDGIEDFIRDCPIKFKLHKAKNDNKGNDKNENEKSDLERRDVCEIMTKKPSKVYTNTPKIRLGLVQQKRVDAKLMLHPKDKMMHSDSILNMAKSDSIKESLLSIVKIAWKFKAHNTVVNAKEGSFIKNQKRYGKSIKEVIGEAIANCLMKRNEFQDLDSLGIVEFKVAPEEGRMAGYSVANWNAVMLYNYIAWKVHAHGDYKSVEEIANAIKMHYENKYKISTQDKDNIDKSTKDIKQYITALNLEEVLRQCKLPQETVIHQQLFDVLDIDMNALKNRYEAKALVPLMLTTNKGYKFNLTTRQSQPSKIWRIHDAVQCNLIWDKLTDPQDNIRGNDMCKDDLSDLKQICNLIGTDLITEKTD